MGLGVVDDIAVLAETDIKNKEQIVKRKSLYSQLKGQISSQDEKIKDQSGTIETLQRQLVQAGIKNQVMKGSVEVNKRVQDSKSAVYKDELDSRAMQKVLRESEKQDSKNRLKNNQEKQKQFENNLEMNN